MESSIWVATITGLPAARQAATIRFCWIGTSSGGISTPRSPRATMMASQRLMISLRLFKAIGFSSLAMTAARPAMSFRASAISSGRWTNDSAIHSTPSCRAKRRSSRSLSVRGDNSSTASGTLTPLLADKGPPAVTLASQKSGPTVSTSRRILPSSMPRPMPGSSAAKISGCGRCARVVSPGVSSRSRRNDCPFSNITLSSVKDPTRNFGPCISAKMPMGRPNSFSRSRIMPIRSA